MTKKVPNLQVPALPGMTPLGLPDHDLRNRCDCEASRCHINGDCQNVSVRTATAYGHSYRVCADCYLHRPVSGLPCARFRAQTTTGGCLGCGYNLSAHPRKLTRWRDEHDGTDIDEREADGRIVAECWTCTYQPKRRAQFIPLLLTDREKDVGHPSNIDYHRAAGHDVRPVNQVSS